MTDKKESKLLFTVTAIYFLCGIYFNDYITISLGVVLMAIWSENIYLDHKAELSRK